MRAARPKRSRPPSLGPRTPLRLLRRAEPPLPSAAAGFLAKYKFTPRVKLFPAALPAAGSSGGGASPAAGKSALQKPLFASKSKSMTVKVSGLSAVHEASGLQDSGVVLQEHGKVYCETMSLADVVSGTNSYYILQLIHETARNRFHIFRKWGRVGTTIGGSKLERFPKDAAMCGRGHPNWRPRRDVPAAHRGV